VSVEEMDWSEITKYRESMDIKHIPLIKHNSLSVWELFRPFVKEKSKILDVGAGKSPYRSELPKNINYKTLDVDKKIKADYRSFSNIPKDSFDGVWMVSVVEHLTIKQFSDYLKQIIRVLKPGGKLIITTHNIHAIPDLTHYDYSHVQHYPLADLYGLTKVHGFVMVGAYRVLDNRGWRKLRNPIKRCLCFFLGVDYAWSVMLVVRKPVG
jgi:SAM-dependent methyltransferase